MNNNYSDKITWMKGYLSLAAIILFMWLFSSSEFFRGLLYVFVNFVTLQISQHHVAGVALFLLLVAISAILSPLSSLPIIPSAIIIWGEIWTVSLLLIGWLIGGIISYIAGLFTRRVWLHSVWPMDRVDYYRQKLSARSQFWIVFLFRMAIPSEIAGYTLGIVRYNFGKYILVTTITEMFMAVGLVLSVKSLFFGGLVWFAVVALVVITCIIIAANRLIIELSQNRRAPEDGGSGR